VFDLLRDLEQASFSSRSSGGLEPAAVPPQTTIRVKHEDGSQTNVTHSWCGASEPKTRIGLLRYYNPVTGRWASRDPLGEEGGLNLYGFVSNAPIFRYDPLGMQAALPSPHPTPFPVPNLRPYPPTTPPVKPPAGCSGTINAIQALMAEYENMKEANTIGADQYFHCIGMCKAARESSKNIADILARLREIGDNLKAGVTSCLDAQEMLRIAEDSLTRDMPANRTGINCPEDKSCEECCKCYKVNGLK